MHPVCADPEYGLKARQQKHLPQHGEQQQPRPAVAQDVENVITDRIEPPECIVERKRQIHQRAAAGSAAISGRRQDRAWMRERANRRVFPDRQAVVKNEGNVDRTVVDRDAGYDDQQREKPASQKSRRKHDSRWVLAARSAISRNEKTPHCEFRTGGTRYVQRTRDRSKGCVSKLTDRGRGAFQAPAGGWKPPLLQHPAASFDSGDTPRPKKRTRDRSKEGMRLRVDAASRRTARGRGAFQAPVAGWAPTGGWKPPLLQPQLRNTPTKAGAFFFDLRCLRDRSIYLSARSSMFKGQVDIYRPASRGRRNRRPISPKKKGRPFWGRPFAA